ncbi:unnamed protein product [Cyprideis torosa]|uniref:Uncharacterized protein n=1 Tax=Cyprideis torosa TaxID=163714 RepID=A0A7R8W618_9CRUS|nr:unnamed protein product [Cyprideis torosa]CAG0880543.1 unnamed protein product [Cyprideis torosa]
MCDIDSADDKEIRNSFLIRPVMMRLLGVACQGGLPCRRRGDRMTKPYNCRTVAQLNLHRINAALHLPTALGEMKAALAHQTFDQEPVYTEVNPGGEATLQCRIYQKRGGCSWQKDGKCDSFLTWCDSFLTWSPLYNTISIEECSVINKTMGRGTVISKSAMPVAPEDPLTCGIEFYMRYEDIQMVGSASVLIFGSGEGPEEPPGWDINEPLPNEVFRIDGRLDTAEKTVRIPISEEVPPFKIPFVSINETVLDMGTVNGSVQTNGSLSVPEMPDTEFGYCAGDFVLHSKAVWKFVGEPGQNWNFTVDWMKLPMAYPNFVYIGATYDPLKTEDIALFTDTIPEGQSPKVRIGHYVASVYFISTYHDARFSAGEMVLQGFNISFELVGDPEDVYATTTEPSTTTLSPIEDLALQNKVQFNFLDPKVTMDGLRENSTIAELWIQALAQTFADVCNEYARTEDIPLLGPVETKDIHLQMEYCYDTCYSSEECLRGEVYITAANTTNALAFDRYRLRQILNKESYTSRFRNGDVTLELECDLKIWWYVVGGGIIAAMIMFVVIWRVKAAIDRRETFAETKKKYQPKDINDDFGEQPGTYTHDSVRSVTSVHGHDNQGFDTEEDELYDRFKPVGIYKNKYEWAGNPDLGDCSLRVLNADLDFDDGDWECQVTASTYQSKDALTSRPARLVVRVPPQTPIIEFNGIQILSGRNLSTSEGAPTSVKCVSRYGNPAAQIRWFIGKRDITVAHSRQMNASELDTEKKWRAESVLNYTFGREHHLKRLKCVAQHEAYEPSRSREVQATLDVQFEKDMGSGFVGGVDMAFQLCVGSKSCCCQQQMSVKLVGNCLLRRKIAIDFEHALGDGRVNEYQEGEAEQSWRNMITVEYRHLHLTTPSFPRGDSPVISVDGVPTDDIEEGDSVLLRCLVQANPPAKVIWKKLGRSDYYNFEPELSFKRIARENSGNYVCEAQNELGKARGNSVEVDPLYHEEGVHYEKANQDKPRITSIGPSVNVTASAFESTSFSCEAEGNPPPKFKWLQRADVRSEAAYERGDRSQLVIQNVTYEHQGLYVCQAINVIKGNEQKGQSDTISLEVQALYPSQEITLGTTSLE